MGRISVLLEQRGWRGSFEKPGREEEEEEAASASSPDHAVGANTTVTCSYTSAPLLPSMSVFIARSDVFNQQKRLPAEGNLIAASRKPFVVTGGM